MTFKVGDPRPAGAGRKKGQLTKRSLDLEELMATKFPGYDPVAAMAEIAIDAKVDLQLRIMCHKEVAKYVRPQLRSTTISGTIGVADLTVGEMPK